MSYGAPPPPNYGQPAYGGAPAGTNGKATASLVTGILGILCCGFFTGIPAIILSTMAKKEIAASGQGGSGMATAGLVLGVISVIFGVISAILIATGNFVFSFNS